MNVYTKILHCNEGTSDKVYIVEINQIDNQYVVSTTYGKRTDPILTTRIISTTKELSSARSAATKAARKKERDYKEANPSLKIAGYKQSNVSVAQLSVDNSQTSNKVIKDEMPVGRKIKL